jgi:hypothetical protein
MSTGVSEDAVVARRTENENGKRGRPLPDKTQLHEYFITFGVQYEHDDHPLGMHPSGYAVIEAPDMETARAIAFAIFDTAYAFVYDREHFIDDGTKMRWHPLGELLRISWTKGRWGA